jgi:uncharacterized protein (DUF608 family)
MQDFGAGFDEATGAIGMRGEYARRAAVDGQAGTLLRVYREHQMSADDRLLRGLWPDVKKALEWLIGQDGNDNGLLEGGQHNTLDTDWYGPSSWLSSLYVAALRAGEAMARELGEPDFAARCRRIADSGS